MKSNSAFIHRKKKVFKQKIIYINQDQKTNL